MTVARRVLPLGVRYALREQYNQVQQRGVLGTVKRNAMLTDAWLRERANRRCYRTLSEDDLRAARKSDTVFIFGSGYSLNGLEASDWQLFRSHDVFGFNAFVYEQWIPIDFHLLRGGMEGADRWRAYADEFSGLLNANPNCSNTIFLMQGEYLAQFCNQLIGYRYLKPGTRIFRYRTNRGDGPPTTAFRHGLRHAGGTLSDTVNAAVCLGWKNLVLVGVDLYDSRYFWLAPDQTYGMDEEGRLVPAAKNLRGQRPHETHNTALNGVVDIMGRWREWLDRERGVTMRVYNPRSLLAGVMPVYAAPAR